MTNDYQLIYFISNQHNDKICTKEYIFSDPEVENPYYESLTFKEVQYAYKSTFKEVQQMYVQSIAPNYLSDLISNFVPPRPIAFIRRQLFGAAKGNTENTGKVFSAAAPRLWNWLSVCGNRNS